MTGGSCQSFEGSVRNHVHPVTELAFSGWTTTPPPPITFTTPPVEHNGSIDVEEISKLRCSLSTDYAQIVDALMLWLGLYAETGNAHSFLCFNMCARNSNTH